MAIFSKHKYPTFSVAKWRGPWSLFSFSILYACSKFSFFRNPKIQPGSPTNAPQLVVQRPQACLFEEGFSES